MRFAILACLSVSACQNEPLKTVSAVQPGGRDTALTLVLADSDGGMPHEVRVGSTIEIHLPTHAGTGYSWEATSSDAQQFRAIGPSSSKSTTAPATTGPLTPRAVGGVEDQTFIFKPFGPGQYQVEFVSRQPWAKGGTGDKITFHFSVKNGD